VETSVSEQGTSTSLLITEKSGERVSVIDSAHVNEGHYAQEVMTFAISRQTFLTVLLNTDLSYLHPDIINIHRMKTVHVKLRACETVHLSVASYVLYNTAEQIYTC
jgi:hypothetical protein